MLPCVRSGASKMAVPVTPMANMTHVRGVTRSERPKKSGAPKQSARVQLGDEVGVRQREALQRREEAEHGPKAQTHTNGHGAFLCNLQASASHEPPRERNRKERAPDHNVQRSQFERATFTVADMHVSTKVAISISRGPRFISYSPRGLYRCDQELVSRSLSASAHKKTPRPSGRGVFMRVVDLQGRVRAAQLIT